MKVKMLKECMDQVPKNVRLMGLDLGSKTIGVAVSDSMQSLATPVTTIQRTKMGKDCEALGKLIEEFEIGGFILGWPLNMDGSQGPRCDAVMSFADEMKQRSEVFGAEPFIALCDERLSTQAVDALWDKHGSKSGDKRRNKEAGVTDKLAAQIILQGALDSFY